MRMRDVAERAGVSPATVSRVLSGSPSVRPDYRERVLKAARELGYRPNLLASNLRKQKAQTIGVVVSDIENPHFTEMVRAVEDGAYRRGYRVVLCNTDENPAKQRSYLEMLLAERVLGVILSPSDPEDGEISRLIDLEIPVVAFDRAVADERADAVVVDNAGGLRMATERLISFGHERIGLISGPEEIETGRERLAGYREAMEKAGLTPVVAYGGFRIGGGREATRSLLSEERSLTALVVSNNLMTIGALGALREMGVRVPRDMALIAVDDPFWAELVEPPLTTLAQPIREMAGCAMEMVFERISGGRSEPRKDVFEFDLKVRGSCGTSRAKEGGEG